MNDHNLPSAGAAPPSPRPERPRAEASETSQGDEALRQQAVFTRREWQRLVFLRWRYRRGDWPTAA